MKNCDLNYYKTQTDAVTPGEELDSLIFLIEQLEGDDDIDPRTEVSPGMNVMWYELYGIVSAARNKLKSVINQHPSDVPVTHALPPKERHHH